MTTTIRNAVSGDEVVLAKLNAFVHDLHLERRPADFKVTAFSDLTAWYKSILEGSGARAWIAEQDSLPVGYVLVIVSHRAGNPFCQERRWLEIDQIAVDPGFRRRGIGRALILKAIAEAETLGVTNVEAQSWVFNQQAHEILRSVGFVPKTIRFELSMSPEDRLRG
jgi:ribosomal protein S18 acetylase RimI-like enzyme